MKLMGLQKLTMLDYPGKLACTVFTGGCNFRCPFCHNAGLVLPDQLREGEIMPEEAFFDFLRSRKGRLEGVAVTGGEPLLQPDIRSFIERIRSLGFPVKLDTNGSFPEKLIELVTAGLVDYVAMDIKNSPAKYARTVAIDGFDLSPVRESVAFLLENRVPYEFRTTVIAGCHTDDDFRAIGEWIGGAERYYLQNFVDSGNLICPDTVGVDEDSLRRFAAIASPFVRLCEVRGI